MFEYFFQKPPAFGLDISDFSVRLARLEKTRKGLKLACFKESKIPSGIVVAGEIKEEEKLSRIIKKTAEAAKPGKLKTEYVVSSLPEEKSYLDVVRIPLMAEKEIKTAVAYEAENQIPLPLDKVYFGFEKIRQVAGNEEYQEILIAAVEKNVVESYLRVLKKSGFKVLGLEIECLAIVRALVRRDRDYGPMLIIDFGGSRTTFIIYSGKSVRFTSTFPFSSRGLTQRLAEKLALEPEEAEKLKIIHGLNGDKKIAKILTRLLEQLVEETKHHLDYYYSHGIKEGVLADGRKPEKILLCGAAANLKGLCGFLEARLGVRVELGNPWVNILKDSQKGAPELGFKKSLAFATTLGLALRGVANY